MAAAQEQALPTRWFRSRIQKEYVSVDEVQTVGHVIGLYKTIKRSVQKET